MGSKSTYANQKVLDEFLGGQNFVPPGTVYVALYTVAPTDTSAGTEVSTGAWTNYARVAITNNLTNWPAAQTAMGITTKWNGTEVRYAQVSCVSNPTVVAFGILDAASGGNLLYYGNLLATMTVINGRKPVFPPGAIIVTED